MRFRLVLILAIVGFTSIVGALETMVFVGSARLLRGIVAGLDVTMILMAMSVLLRNRNFYAVWLWVGLVFGGVLTLVYNSDRFGIVAQANGIRGMAFALSSLIVMHDVFESDNRIRFEKWFTVFLFIFAAVQTPLSLFQFFTYGAGDAVGGTYGTDGGSGLVTQLLFLIVFYFVVRYGSLDGGTNFSIRKLLLFAPLLLPAAINETKISFVLLALMIVLISFSREKWYKTIPFMALGVALFAVFFYYYSQTVGDTEQIFTEKFVERYLYSAPKSEQGGDIPRFLRISLMFQLFREDPLSIIIGMGYGIFGGGTVIGVTRLARSFFYLTTGSRILLVTVWLQGGLIAFLVMLGGAFGYLKRALKAQTTVKRLGLFLAGMLALMWIYNEALLDRAFAVIVTYVMVWVSHGGQEGEIEPGTGEGEEGEAEAAEEAEVAEEAEEA